MPNIEIGNCQVYLSMDKKSVGSERDRSDQNSGFSTPLLAPLVSNGFLLSSSSSILETLDGLIEDLLRK